jgi:hypothetical protein
MERKPVGKKRPHQHTKEDEGTLPQIQQEPDVKEETLEEVIMKQQGQPAAARVPVGYVMWKFFAVNTKTQNLIFSNDETNWFSFDGLPVR